MSSAYRDEPQRLEKVYIPKFANILGAYQLSRLIGCEWWRRVYKDCVRRKKGSAGQRIRGERSGGMIED